MSWSLWHCPLPITLFKRCGMHAQMVGIAEGVFGIFCVVSGLPAGWLADHMRRDRLLRIFGCLMLGAPFG